MPSDKPEAQETLAELFARDPFDYTKDDIDRIILYYRESRASFNLGGKAAASPKIDLGELGLGPTPALPRKPAKLADLKKDMGK